MIIDVLPNSTIRDCEFFLTEDGIQFIGAGPSVITTCTFHCLNSDDAMQTELVRRNQSLSVEIESLKAHIKHLEGVLYD